MEKAFLMIDAHVHLHPSFDHLKFLNNARINFEKGHLNLEGKNFYGFLLLTESGGVNVFQELCKLSYHSNNIGSWKIQKTQNLNSLMFINNGFKLFIIAGKQIITKENLEVLAIGLNEEIMDGNPIGEVIKYVTESNSIPIIPWGFGKWLGKRKTTIENLILQNNFSRIFLGDNGNRPKIIPYPEFFRIGIRKGIYNLPGSDPLPFSKEISKPGSYGFILETVFDEDKPFECLYNIITKSNSQFITYGKNESLFKFLKNQFAMQLLKVKKDKIIYNN